MARQGRVLVDCGVLSDDPKERMRLYKEYVMQKRPYEMMVDKGLKI